MSNQPFRTAEHLSVFPPSLTSSGLPRYLRRVCNLKSCGPPTSPLCQQHRRFFWRKWKNSYSVVRPTTVRPAYGVPKVSDILPPRPEKASFFLNDPKVLDQSKIYLIAEIWNINQTSHPSYLSLLLSDCSTL